ncbi:hypothetical protein FOA52_008457 [Chlamydomonas sp. UWO 241]|nr:hypothetical protein FOA52_008457 [Chlamydomonas sp. UWO 241]
MRWMNLVGVYRPNWIASAATGIASDASSARLSYPSGHAAYMFSSMTVVSLFLLGHFRVLSRPQPGQFALAVMCLVPIMLATFVAVSRVYDYKHATSDINAGCFVGLASGLFAYSLNYHSLGCVASHLPRARVWSTVGLSGVRAPPSPTAGS